MNCTSYYGIEEVCECELVYGNTANSNCSLMFSMPSGLSYYAYSSVEPISGTITPTPSPPSYSLPLVGNYTYL